MNEDKEFDEAVRALLMQVRRTLRTLHIVIDAHDATKENES